MDAQEQQPSNSYSMKEHNKGYFFICSAVLFSILLVALAIAFIFVIVLSSFQKPDSSMGIVADFAQAAVFIMAFIILLPFVMLIAYWIDNKILSYLKSKKSWQVTDPKKTFFFSIIFALVIFYMIPRVMGLISDVLRLFR